MTEPIGMIQTMIDDAEDSTIEVAITRPAMDMISGKPGIDEAEFVDRFSYELEELVEVIGMVSNRDHYGRVVVSAYWVEKMMPWCGTAEAGADAFGRLN